MTYTELDPEIAKVLEEEKSSVYKEESQKAKAVKDIKALDTSDHCYACKQAIDNSKATQLSAALAAEIADLDTSMIARNKVIESLNFKVTKNKAEKKAYDDNQKSIDRFTQLSQLIDVSIPKEYPDFNNISNKLRELKNKYESEKITRDEAITYNDSVKIRNAKIDALKEQIRDFKARQELIKNDIVIIQEEISNLTILRKAFSTSGIVAYKLENVAKQLEESINYYLALLSDGQFQVLFRLTGDKLNIVVINNGEEVSIESLSGGEFSRVQTSVLLAVRGTLSKIGGKSINLLFLDEITGVLDETGKERLFEVLQEEKDLNVFLISHDYSHPLIPRIEIEKTNNISTIRS